MHIMTTVALSLRLEGVLTSSVEENCRPVAEEFAAKNKKCPGALENLSLAQELVTDLVSGGLAYYMAF